MRQWRSLAAAAVSFSVAPAATAQDELDAERFKPALTYDAFIMVEGSDVRPADDRWEFKLFANYAHQPLVIANNGDVSSTIIGGRAGIDLIGSFTIIEPVAVGIGVPVFLGQHGDADPGFAGLGDLRIAPKVRILDDRRHVGLGIVGELRVPTHAGDFAGGARNVQFIPKVVFDHRFVPSGFRIGANAGVAIREGTTVGNIEAASEFVYGVAAAYRFGGYDGPVELGGELVGGLGFVELDAEEAPLEGILFVKGHPDEEWELSAGPGVGMVPGWGVPTVRLFVGLTWKPTSHDRDGDGISDDDDQCPDVAEDRDGDEDWDGCPEEEADDDVDGIPNSEDDCPEAKETINGIDDDDGCPDTGDPRVVYQEGEFMILEAVEFESGSAQIKPDSYTLLNQVALMMKANPGVEHIRVEGHTDETGTRELNMQLSQQRADSVRSYLVNQGVAPQRLSAKGFGPDEPLVDESDPDSYAKNRRVEFIVDD